MTGLRDVRVERGFTLEEVAFLSELSQSTISRLERGLIREPRPVTLVGLARALGISPSALSQMIREERDGRSG